MIYPVIRGIGTEKGEKWPKIVPTLIYLVEVPNFYHQWDALGAVVVSDEDAHHKFFEVHLLLPWDSLAMTNEIRSYSSYPISSSKATPTATPGLADEVIHSFLATNADDVDLIHEDLDKLKVWMLRPRDVDWENGMWHFDMRKVECSNCHNKGHLQRECKFQGSKELEGVAAGSKQRSRFSSIECGMSSTVKMGLGYGIKSNAEVLGYEEEISRGFQFTKRSTTVPKPQQTVDPSCAQHVKTPRQPIRTPVTPSPIPSHNRQNRNQGMQRDLVRGLPSKSFKNDHTCVACQKGKQHKASCKAKIDRYVTHPLHTLHMDLFGPTSVRSINHASYCLVITDDYSRFCWVFFLAKKDETSGILKTFIRQIENQLTQKVKIIRSDNGTEFKNRVMLEFCGEKGIKQEFSNARTPQQNGVAERMNRTLIEAARTMLADSHLPTTFWAEAVNTACYTFNRNWNALLLKHLGPVPTTVPTSTNPVNTGSINLNTAFEEVNTGNAEAISPSADHEEEVFSDADDDDMPEIRIYDKSSEGIFDKASYDDDGIITDFNNLPDEVDVPTNPTLRIHNAHPQSQILGDPNTPVQTRSSLKKITEAHALVSYMQAQQRSNHKDQQHCLFACFLSQSEPKKVSEALEDASWVEAMQEELLQFKLQQVWVLVDLPNGAKVIGTRWVYRNKKDERGYDPIFGSTKKSWVLNLNSLNERKVSTRVLYGRALQFFWFKCEVWQFSNGNKGSFGSRMKGGLQILVLSRFQVTPKVSHLYAVKRIFKYIKGKPKLGLWYPRESPLDLVAYSDSDYAAANLRQIEATSITEAEDVAAEACLWSIAMVLLGVEKGDARSTWTWKRKCQLSLANWMQFGCFLFKPTESAGYTEIVDFLRGQIESLVKEATPLADASGINMLQNEVIFVRLKKILGQPQPSADPTPSQSVPATSSSHVQITQPPPTLTHSVQPPPQPSSVQPTATTPPTQPVQTTSPPPVSTIPDIQPTLPPSPQIPSPSYHDTEGPSFEPSYHMSPPPSHEPEIQASRSSEESEQLRNLMDIVPRLESRVKSLEKELSETKQTLGTEIFKLNEKVKELEDKLRKKRKSKETMDAQGQDQDVPSQTDQGDTFATPEKSKGSGEAQEEQISPSTLEAAQILTNVASEGFKGSQAPLGSKIYKRKSKSTKTPTKILHFEEPDSAQVNTAQVNTAELNPDSTPSAQVNTGEVNAAEVNTGEAERVQRRKGKEPMTEEDLQAEVQASKTSKELQELADLEEAQRLQAKMDAETQRQIDLDALLARRLVEQEEEAAQEALATEFDYIQARLNADQILAEKLQQEEREQYSIEDRAKFLHDTIAAQRKFLAEQRSAAIRNKPPTISQLRNQMITYLKHVANKKHAELKSKSFEEIQVLYERYKKQDQTFVAIGTEEDERAIKKINEKDTDKEEEKKDESVHEEVKEEEGAKKRKLGTRRKLKAKRRKHASGLTREDDDLKICLHIAPDEDKVVDVESLNQQYPIIEWQSFFLTTKPQHDQTKPDEDIYLNKTYKTKLEGFDKMLWGDLMIMFNQGDAADFWDTQQNWKLISWKLHSSSGVHTIMTSTGLVIHMFVENRYPLTKEVLSNMLELKLETEEESSMALELIKFVKQQLEEFEDSNDDDTVTSTHEDAERV
ncbi:putative ribonuclease H-like domain-containing protein [Tanacetum coccineum]